MRALAIGLAATDIWRREICCPKTGSSSWMDMMLSTSVQSVSSPPTDILDKLTSRRSNKGSRPHLPLGQSNPIPPRVRPIHLPPTMPTTSRYRMPPSQQEARRYRFLGRPREHRGRILVHRRKDVPRYRPRICRSRYHHDQNRS
jgi:hypothetical protein